MGSFIIKYAVVIAINGTENINVLTSMAPKRSDANIYIEVPIDIALQTIMKCNIKFQFNKSQFKKRLCNIKKI